MMNERLKWMLKALPGAVPAVRWAKRRKREFEVQNIRMDGNVRARVDRYLAQTHAPRLNVGAGPYPLPGWLNVDYQPSSAEVVFLDATKPFLLPDDAFTHVFTEHMIEHIPYPDGLHMLRECHRVLRPGGRIRVATPDLMQFVKMFQADKTEAQVRYLNFAVSEYFPEPRVHNACFLLNGFVREWGHQFVYDEPTLILALQTAGFQDLVRCEVGLSADPALNGCEQHARDHGEECNRFETMVLEGRKR